MMNGAMPQAEPITRALTVPGPVEHAFRVFTEGMGRWWPLETHSIAVDQELGQKAVTLEMEPRRDGRIEEVLEDGSRRHWADVVLWDPPHRVVYAWKPNDLPTPPTEVEVRFTAEGDGTRVDLEHRSWEGLGDLSEQVRPLYASEGGWTLVLGLFGDAVRSEAAG
jgi:uncharacterized protein YndB with AHSA1/START domain